MHAPNAHDRCFALFAPLLGGASFTRLLSPVVIAALAGSGCLADEPAVSETAQAATVSTYVASGCSTAVVLGLSKQIADEIGCASPALLRRFAPSARIQLTSNAVLPYLAGAAKTSLEQVAQTRTVQINSAFRTVAQQYLLYRWYLAGRCGITAAATPGRSNHESGRALDLANYGSMISAMAARGWSHSVPGDPVHFDHFGSPDIRGEDVRAFQRLWNSNHPGDAIAVDGAYGPQTEARLRQAPATGFAIGPSCGSTNYVADVISVDGPDRVQPLVRARYVVTLQNNGDREWPATAMLRTASGAASVLADASWRSSAEITELGATIAPGGSGEVKFDVTTPNASDETPIFEELELADGTIRLGEVHLALTVVPGLAEPTSGEADDIYDQEVTGGCAAGGSSAGLLLALGAAGVGRRRRSRAIARDARDIV